jgi:hypothetical protein
MNNHNLTELCQSDLIKINGGDNEEYFNFGYSVGQTIGKMTRNFLTLTGIARLLAFL